MLHANIKDVNIINMLCICLFEMSLIKTNNNTN